MMNSKYIRNVSRIFTRITSLQRTVYLTTPNIQFVHNPKEQSLCVPTRPPVQFVRQYAKGKDKKKEKGKAKIEINENQLAELINLDSFKKQMEKPIAQLKEDFINHLSVRSSAGSLEQIKVNFDGKEYTLQELAQVARKNPKTVVINMSVFPQAIPSALQAIQKSGMNLNPQQEGTTLYIPVPKVTKEHRETLAKSAKQYFVKCRDTIRDVQIKYVKQVKRKEGISEDICRNVESQIISLADGYIGQADKIFESKQHELLGD